MYFTTKENQPDFRVTQLVDNDGSVTLCINEYRVLILHKNGTIERIPGMPKDLGLKLNTAGQVEVSN